MSAKIIKAVNSMIANADKISEATPVEPTGELVFKYDKKYIWGSMRRGDDIFLYFYPGQLSVPGIVGLLQDIDTSDIPMVTYATKDIGTREASDSFKDLHLLVTEKVFGVDQVLDDIIEDDVPF